MHCLLQLETERMPSEGGFNDGGGMTTRRLFARERKAASESLWRMVCFIEQTTRWHSSICSSMGNLAAMEKNQCAKGLGVVEARRAGLIWRRPSQRKTIKANISAASSSNTPSFTQSSWCVCAGLTRNLSSKDMAWAFPLKEAAWRGDHWLVCPLSLKRDETSKVRPSSDASNKFLVLFAGIDQIKARKEGRSWKKEKKKKKKKKKKKEKKNHFSPFPSVFQAHAWVFRSSSTSSFFSLRFFLAASEWTWVPYDSFYSFFPSIP